MSTLMTFVVFVFYNQILSIIPEELISWVEDWVDTCKVSSTGNFGIFFIAQILRKKYTFCLLLAINYAYSCIYSVKNERYVWYINIVLFSFHVVFSSPLSATTGSMFIEPVPSFIGMYLWKITKTPLHDVKLFIITKCLQTKHLKEVDVEAD